MKLSILQENLLRGLTTTGRIVSSRPQVPILQNVLLRTTGGRLLVETTSLDLTETTWCDGKIIKEGSACVSAKLLSEYVSSLPAQALELTEKEGSLVVSSQGFQATIAGVPSSEFPPTPTSGRGTKSPVDTTLFVAALSRVLFAASLDEARPLLSGVRFQTHGKTTTMVATDGYRLSKKEVQLGMSDGLDVIVSARALLEVVHICREEKEVKRLDVATTDDGQLVFVVGDTELYTRRIDGEYPSVDKIIPTAWSTRAILDREAFIRAAKSAAIFARDNANIVRLRVGDERVVISANAPSVGENTIDVEAKVEGEGGEIAFNSRFLLEFLSVYPEDQVVFEMTGSLNPGVFRPPNDPSFFHIIMPVRVQA